MLAVLLGSATLAQHASAGPVAIANHSFEEPNCTTSNCSALNPWGVPFTAVGSVVGWQISGTAGVILPSGVPSFSAVGYGATDGNQIGYANGGGSLTQELQTTLEANTLYVLSVDVGNRPDPGYSPFAFAAQLYAGNALLANDDGSEAGVAPGSFETVTLQYAAFEGDPLIGQALSIKLLAYGIQTNWDNVRLDALPIPANQVPTPVPAALPLLLSSLASLGFMRRRRG